MRTMRQLTPEAIQNTIFHVGNDLNQVNDTERNNRQTKQTTVKQLRKAQ